MSVDQIFLERLFQRLQAATIPYCVLRNWETLPESVANDVDLWVDESRGKEIEELLRGIGGELGWRLVQRWHWLASRGDGLYVFAKPETRDCLIIDVFHFLTWKGLRYVDENAFRRLAAPHPKGFLFLPPGVESASIVVKEVLFEGALRERYRERAVRMAKADREGFLAALAPTAGPSMARRILDLVVAEQWDQLAAARHRLRLELAGRWLARDPLHTVRLCARHFFFRARHRLRPPGGFFLVLIGPDGAGKTTTANALLETKLMSQLFSSASYLYRRFPIFPELKAFLPPPLRRRLTLSPEQEADMDASSDAAPPPSATRSTMYLVYYGIEYFLGRVWLWKECALGNRMVVFDRYWYEFLLQERYQRCPKFLLDWIERVAAKPDAVVFLDVDPDVAYERKREKPLAEIRRLHRLCGEIAARSDRGHTFHPCGVEQSVGELERIILERLVARAPADLAARSA